MIGKEHWKCAECMLVRDIARLSKDRFNNFKNYKFDSLSCHLYYLLEFKNDAIYIYENNEQVSLRPALRKLVWDYYTELEKSCAMLNDIGIKIFSYNQY